MNETALPWLVLELTHSPLAVGTLVVCRFLPTSLFGLFVGVIADRVDNRRCMIAADAALTILTLMLAILTLGGLVQLWQIYVIATLTGVATLLESPSRHSLTYETVGREELTNAVALNATLTGASRILGPAVGGVVIAAFGTGWCFALNGASYLAILAALLLMRANELIPVDRGGSLPRAVQGFGEAVAFVRATPSVKAVLGLACALSLLGFNVRVHLPLLADTTLATGAAVFGLLFALFGLGSLVGALLAASLGGPSAHVMFAATGAYAIAILMLASLQSAAVVGVFLFVIGVCYSVWSATAQSIVQLAAPDRLRGRLVGFVIWAFLGVQPLGGFLVGWLTDVGGTRAAFLVAGCASVTVTVAGALTLAGARRRVGEP